MVKTPQERIKYIREWQRNNPEKFKEYNKKWRSNNLEKIRSYDRASYERRKTKISERIKTKRLTDPEWRERKRVYMKKWHENNKEWDDNYKKLAKPIKRKWYIKNRDEILDDMHKSLVNMRSEVIYWYSNGAMQCADCGENKPEFLVLDHIDSDGYSDRKKYKGNIIKRIVRDEFPGGFQVLCHNCNIKKRFKRIVRKNPSAAYHKYRDKIRLLTLKKYSGPIPKCACCGISDINLLTFHHVDGGGRKLQLKLKYHSLTQYLYKNNIPKSKIIVLCHNCNNSLGHYGYCPHNMTI